MPRLATVIAFKWVSVLEKWDLEVYIVVHLCVTIFGMAVREVDVMVIVAKSLV